MHHRERILGPMIDLASEQQLTFLGLLAIRDVDGHATDARNPAGGILAGRGRAQAPTHTAVRTTNTEFNLIGTSVPSGLSDGPAQRYPIVAMDQLPNADEGNLEGRRIDPEYLLLPFVPGAIAADQIPIPGSHLAGRKGEIAAILALLQ